MDINTEIKMLLVKRKVTATQLAEKIGMSQPGLSKKMKNNTWTVLDLQKISEALGVTLKIEFVE